MQFKSLMLICSLLLSMATVAQDTLYVAPDYADIQTRTFDSKSDDYYPDLLNMYLSNDTTLTTEDYRTLYYGFTLQEDYNPYKETPTQKGLSNYLTRKVDSTAHCDSVLYYAQKMIDDTPFDLRSINMMIYGYSCIGAKSEVDIWTKKLTGLLDAILSTGSGKEEKSPIHVISVSDEYVILNLLGLVPQKQSLIDSLSLDYFEVEDNEFDVDGIYFNVNRMLGVFQKKFDDAK